MIDSMKRVAQLYGSADMAKAADTFEDGFNMHKSKKLVGSRFFSCFILCELDFLTRL